MEIQQTRLSRLTLEEALLVNAYRGCDRLRQELICAYAQTALHDANTDAPSNVIPFRSAKIA